MTKMEARGIMIASLLKSIKRQPEARGILNSTVEFIESKNPTIAVYLAAAELLENIAEAPELKTLLYETWNLVFPNLKFPIEEEEE